MSIAMPVADDVSQTRTEPREEVAPNGRLRLNGLSDTDRNLAVATHLSPYGFFIIGPFALLAPLVLWLIRKDQSAFNDDHGREIINFMISLLAWGLICVFTVIGLLFLPVVLVVAFISPIRAAAAASRGEYFRYPMTFRFLS